MEVVVSTERRFYMGSDGRAYCADGTRAYPFWTRYHRVFDHVTVLARLSRHRIACPQPMDGPGVSLLPLPDYQGLKGALSNRRLLRRKIAEACDRRGAFILRVPGLVGEWMRRELARRGTPFGAEVVGDPYDVFSPGAYHHPLRPAIRVVARARQRKLCRQAMAVAYVTRYALQRRYPPAPHTFTVNYSSVDLGDDAFCKTPRTYDVSCSWPQLVTVGTFEQLYKGPHILIGAVDKLVRAGCSVRLRFVGDGRYRGQMQQLADCLGVSSHVRFVGRRPSGPAIRAELDSADMFVLPSLVDGLPRAMIEAMARGMPCIGSHVGGIPELLEANELVPPGDAEALAAKIGSLAADPHRLTRLSAENLNRAFQYHQQNLDARRVAFYQQVSDGSQRYYEGRARRAA